MAGFSQERRKFPVLPVDGDRAVWGSASVPPDPHIVENGYSVALLTTDGSAILSRYLPEIDNRSIGYSGKIAQS